MSSSSREPSQIPAAGARIRRGLPDPLGATILPGAVRFAVFSRHAAAVTLLLYDDPRAEPVQRIPLDPARHRTGDVWHAEVEGVGPGQVYAYAVDGPFAPQEGHRFNPRRVLLDPYGRGVTSSFRWDVDPVCSRKETPERVELTLQDPAAEDAPKSVVVDCRFDWGDDRYPRTPLADSVIYEMHLRGFTRHPSSGVNAPGTYRGVIERIPYLRDLGVTALELLPVHAFNEHEFRRVDPLNGEPLSNYWGYNPLAYFAPHGRYASAPDAAVAADEFRSMVRALHAAGIEVILDVVFNHTGEGGVLGPTVAFKGLDNAIYYLRDPAGRAFLDLTGCGNTVNCNHPVVSDLITDCLRYWVTQMRVDGFRFDLAVVLARDSDGELMDNPPLLERLAEDPVLRDTKLIAEAWDLRSYRVGSFFPRRWAEWNGRFRDDVRRFWRGDSGAAAELATRIAGSADLYGPAARPPYHSINFVTSHDGFPLRDVVSYAAKHNLANGEDNRDGDSHEVSWNLGVEGESVDPLIVARRRRQVKNLLASLLLAQGVPMLAAGDEFFRTQFGNNNAYCQDNELSWLDWDQCASESDLGRFVRGLIAFRRTHPALRRRSHYQDAGASADGRGDVVWFGPGGGAPHWKGRSRGFGCMIDGRRAATGAAVPDHDLLFVFHRGADAVDWALPPAPGGNGWQRVADTARISPEDWRNPGEEVPIETAGYRVQPDSVVVLVALPA